MSKLIGEWQQQGKLSVWHYPDARRDWLGWHLSASREARRSVGELLSLMRVSPVAVRCTLTLFPERLAVVNPSARWASASSLTLSFLPDAASDMWQLDSEGNRLTLLLGADKLGALQVAIVTLSLTPGGDDYALGPDTDARKGARRDRIERQRLWFWAARDAEPD